jgi:hypothetical protein
MAEQDNTQIDGEIQNLIKNWMKARFRENLTKFCIWNTNLIEWKKKKTSVSR